MPDPILILFGATGDLAAKKILPALQQWDGSPPPFAQVWCLGRRAFTTAEYCAFIAEKGQFSFTDTLRHQLHYHQLDFTAQEDFTALAQALQDAQPSWRTAPRLFFLAVKPEAFVAITQGLHRSGLLDKGNTDHRLLFEKPFGKDLASAKQIQQALLPLADEEQLYRIDHYLGKEMIRNLLTIRFANRLFSESWHGGDIEQVEITGIETAGVQERLEYYDQAGAINDMIQSHLLQMLALTAMPAPDNFHPESIRAAKLDILKHISIASPPIIGQYADYQQTRPNSQTETYVEIALAINTPAWQGTRFLLRTGKKLAQKRTAITLDFKAMNLCLTCEEKQQAPANKLIIEVFPQEGIQLYFNSKIPGYGFEMEQVQADYCHSCRIHGNQPEAYVKLLKDALQADKTLFAGFEELSLQWQIADAIHQATIHAPLIIYPAGIARITAQGECI